MTWKLHEHQEKALRRLKNGSILSGGVGTGKSMVACAYYVQNEAPRDIVVITTARKRDSLDWQREFARFAIGTEPDKTVAGVLTIDSWNNIGKYAKRTGCFFIFDEQRLVGSGSWVKAFLKIARGNRWLLLSATPGDTWLEYIPVFLAHGFYETKTEFKAKHVVYKPYQKFPVVDRYVGTKELYRHLEAILVDMPFVRHTRRHTVEIPVDYDVEATRQAIRTRWNPFSEEPMRGAAEMYGVLRKITNTHPDRREALKAVLRDFPRLIVFYNFDYELEILRGLEGVVKAEWNGHKHEPVPEGDSWLYFVQYQAGAEAWECVATNAIFFWSQTYSYKIFEQAYGRIDRMNTKYNNLYYFLPMSNSLIDKSIRRAMLAKKDFNERSLTDFQE